jgi:hypothetical protein
MPSPSLLLFASGTAHCALEAQGLASVNFLPEREASRPSLWLVKGVPSCISVFTPVMVCSAAALQGYCRGLQRSSSLYKWILYIDKYNIRSNRFTRRQQPTQLIPTAGRTPPQPTAVTDGQRPPLSAQRTSQHHLPKAVVT